MNHYPHHIGDYIKSTVHLSDAEDLAYRRLIEFYYDTESPIPLETQTVSKRLRLGSEVVENVLKEFFQKTDKGWRHKRCDLEINAYLAKCERNRQVGKLGGRPKKTQMVSENNRLETQPEPEPEPEPLKPKTQKKSSKGSQVPEDFLPDETGLRLAKESGVPIEVEILKFKDFHASKGSVMKDWQAAFRTWIRNAIKFNGYTKPDPQRSTSCIVCGKDGVLRIGSSWYCRSHDQHSPRSYLS